MSKVSRTSIEWTDYAVNPIKFHVPGKDKPVNLCVPISEGCRNCYAAGIVKRFHNLTYNAQTLNKAECFLDDECLQHMLSVKPRGPFRNGIARPRVFVCDMTDMFGDWVPDEMIDRLFAVFALRPDVDWQILTKRPERMAEYLADLNARSLSVRAAGHEIAGGFRDGINYALPLPNVMLGTSVEDQATANQRIPHLLRCPAAVRFLSVEPLLGCVQIGKWTRVPAGEPKSPTRKAQLARLLDGMEIDWVIVGGESGRGARPCNIEHIRSVVRQCRAAGVACFVKQLGSRSYDTSFADQYLNKRMVVTTEADLVKAAKSLGTYMDNVDWPQLRDPKGGNMDEWPEDLRVREMPA